jgi:hypothetical protein
MELAPASAFPQRQGGIGLILEAEQPAHRLLGENWEPTRGPGSTRRAGHGSVIERHEGEFVEPEVMFPSRVTYPAAVLVPHGDAEHAILSPETSSRRGR